jgi:cyclase
MAEKRIIPCLDIKGGKVVKGVNFVNLKDIGDPVEIAKEYERQGAGEIVFLDISATNEAREAIYPLLERAAGELTTAAIVFGGGIRSLEDFRKAFNCGASKASVNSAAVANPSLIREAANEFGGHRIVAAIDGKGRNVYIKGGNENTGLDICEWAKKCEELGAGEILLTSKDADGARDGYDIEMTKAVVDSVGIPVIASGGCGRVSDIIEVFRRTGCGAALAASLFHYGMASVGEVKTELERNGIKCG